MACGKTRAGRLLAQKLNRKFIDTDNLIEIETGLTIVDIFAKHGEDYFRRLERQTIQTLSKQHRVIVSLGGGAVMDPATQQIIKTGIWIFIDTPFDIIKERVSRRSHRPLAKDPDRLKELYNLRLPTYKAAPVIIAANGDADETCQMILQRILSHEYP